ncbi:MarR family transcriptional regulator [Streptomyces sp. NPDC047000]|uniref:MarR family transcriptional regulator n=1 Tax=Streptomyces sp. NPDC047000 TaxID=3155474 RepID=UPI0033CEA53E
MSGQWEGVRDALGRVGFEVLAQALTACGRDGYTGDLRVSGSPGGTFRLRGGLVVAAETPGAPGPETLLLRSGRVTGEQWAELVRESGGARWPAAALIAHGYAGAAQLRVVCVMALQDAAFAVTAGQVDACRRVGTGDPGDAAFAPVAVGEGPLRLLQDAARRLAALASLPYPVHPDRERPVPGVPPRHPTALQAELLHHADGRRTARDLAFRCGRGVYTVTVEVGRMLAEGLLECTAAPVPIPVRVAPEGSPLQRRAPAPPPPPPPPPSPSPGPVPVPLSLPRRTPGASGIADALAPEKNGPGWRGFFRLRNGTPR